MAADGNGGLVCLGAVRRGAVDDLERDLIDILHELHVKGALALQRVGLLQTLCQCAVAAEVDAEAADRPEQEFDVALDIAVIGLGRVSRAANFGVVDGNFALVAFDGDGDGLFRFLFIRVDPDAKGDELRIKLRQIANGIIDSQVLHSYLLFRIHQCFAASSATMACICSHFASMSVTSLSCARVRTRLCSG